MIVVTLFSLCHSVREFLSVNIRSPSLATKFDLHVQCKLQSEEQVKGHNFAPLFHANISTFRLSESCKVATHSHKDIQINMLSMRRCDTTETPIWLERRDVSATRRAVKLKVSRIHRYRCNRLTRESVSYIRLTSKSTYLHGNQLMWSKRQRKRETSDMQSNQLSTVSLRKVIAFATLAGISDCTWMLLLPPPLLHAYLCRVCVK